MIKKISFLIFLFFFSQIVSAQNEFITIWEPNTSIHDLLNPVMPSAAGDGQIWFPGIGENYRIVWEEVGFPSHTGIMNDVTSAERVLIDFGTPFNPNPADAAYRVKVSNGNGIFRQIKFGKNTISSSPILDFPVISTSGSTNKITEIEQWGNIHWTSMNNAFAQCMNIELTATDSPDLSNVEDASMMFNNAFNFKGAPSMANWDTSHIKNFKYMFGYLTTPPVGFALNESFNAPIGSWDMSSAEDLSYMLMRRKIFNQNLNSWNVSKVTNMAYMLAEMDVYNQPMNNWNTSKVTNMTFMFHFNPVFNQPLDQWNTSNVTNMGHMFHGCNAFNQPINVWDTSKVTDMNTMFTEATSFNQSLQDWNIPALVSGSNMFLDSGVNCENYSKILYGWAHNPNTANNIYLQSLSPLIYSVAVINERNILIGKGWAITGDSVSECSFLGTSDIKNKSETGIYPNPATDFIYVRNSDAKNYTIFDQSGRIIARGILANGEINIHALITGNYILQINSRGKSQSFKFIKK
ncbi:surface protein [Chryseobacterium ginsenosidimutans]|uniref:BspA family leucine-rich repeat surface protein n=1 Tax=Chryseobacterium ginsenosidimutans TaxID=687846 RepID=UPI00278A2DFF|nr:BspA family leucine-rich repeat surface protein [Chryseobacterium ginsenosidimutans]MDQ0593272.1 surface protein [Chryseobacterium ginsenosidimutans]